MFLVSAALPLCLMARSSLSWAVHEAVSPLTLPEIVEIFASFVDISDKITDQLTIRLVLNGHPSLNTLQTTFSPIKCSFLFLYLELTGQEIFQHCTTRVLTKLKQISLLIYLHIPLSPDNNVFDDRVKPDKSSLHCVAQPSTRKCALFVSCSKKKKKILGTHVPRQVCFGHGFTFWSEICGPETSSLGNLRLDSYPDSLQKAQWFSPVPSLIEI